MQKLRLSARGTSKEPMHSADTFRIPHRHGNYTDLAHNPEVDVIYVATPHPFHKECAMLCLEAGKAVLCEKPLTVNAEQAEEMIACARHK